MWYFLSFLYSHQGAPKDNDEERGSSGTHLFGTVLVSSIITADGGEQLYVTEQPRCLTITKPAGKSASDTQNETRCFSCVWHSFKYRGVPDDAIEILHSSRSESTKKQYWAYYLKWMGFFVSKFFLYIYIFKINVNYVLVFTNKAV